MNKDRELMQQALEALQLVVWTNNPPVNKAITALRERLAQPEQEPVAWWHDMGGVVDLNVSGHGRPLYFAPPRREWQGLTEEEIEKVCVPLGAAMLSFPEVARAIEAKLKEKNA